MTAKRQFFHLFIIKTPAKPLIRPSPPFPLPPLDLKLALVRAVEEPPALDKAALVFQRRRQLGLETRGGLVAVPVELGLG
jgi:hypothetical protein